MAQARYHDNTLALPHETSRRGFFAFAAAVAAVACPKAVAAAPAPDPIFEAIELHRAIFAAALVTLKWHCSLETELRDDKRRSSVYCGGTETLFKGDDPRWIESCRALALGWSEADKAAVALATVKPTTPAGAVALMRYAIEHDADGHAWDVDDLIDDAGTERHWYYFVIENAAAALAA